MSQYRTPIRHSLHGPDCDDPTGRASNEDTCLTVCSLLSVTEVTVTLTSDEALILFELLHRWEEAGKIDTVLLPGEQTALWALSSRLESILVEPFQGNYRELVDHARQRLAEPDGA